MTSSSKNAAHCLRPSNEGALRKATGRGFTVLPNNVIDQILTSAAKHKADSLALALYLVRHIAGQQGTLVLAGDFSQAIVCEDLGWGATNRARLKRALADLEALHFVASELRDNNTVVLRVVATVDPHVNVEQPPEGCKESLQAPRKISSQPPCEKSSQASRSGAFSSFSYKNKNTELNLLHPEARDIPGQQTLVEDDDDVEKLLGLYRSELKKSVSPRIARHFADTYATNGKPFDLVAAGFRSLAAHPKMRVDTASPNAVWELDYIQRRAREFDQRMRVCLSEQSRRGASCEDMASAIAQAAHDTGIPPEALRQHFSADLAVFEADRAADKARWASWNDASVEITAADASPASCDSHAPALSASETPRSNDQVPSGLPAPTSVDDQEAAVSRSPQNEHLDVIERAIVPSELCNVEAVDTTSSSESREEEGVAVTACANEREQRRRVEFPPALGRAKSLPELRQLIAEALRGELPDVVRDRLVVLAELSAIERTSFEMLRRIVRYPYRLAARQLRDPTSCVGHAQWGYSSDPDTTVTGYSGAPIRYTSESALACDESRPSETRLSESRHIGSRYNGSLVERVLAKRGYLKRRGARSTRRVG